jgi:hypothetical protein
MAVTVDVFPREAIMACNAASARVSGLLSGVG